VIGALFDDLKHKVDGMLKLAVAGAVVSAAAMAAFICFVVALFLWTQQNYGTLEAWLALGGLFILVAALGGAVMLAVRRRRRLPPRARPPEPSAIAKLLQEPAVLLTGIQVARVLGARGMLTLLILGAVAGGVMMNRNGHAQRPHQHESAEHESADSLG
jgi:hypothetical protein